MKSSRTSRPRRLRNSPRVHFLAFAPICYDFRMRRTAIFSLGIAMCAPSFVCVARTQTDAGGLELIARITPTGARAEPVRQFTFFILTKSYSEIVKEVEDKDPVPPRDQFIDSLKVSP